MVRQHGQHGPQWTQAEPGQRTVKYYWSTAREVDQLFQGEFRVVDREFQALEHGLFVYLSGRFAPCKITRIRVLQLISHVSFDQYLHQLWPRYRSQSFRCAKDCWSTAGGPFHCGPGVPQGTACGPFTPVNWTRIRNCRSRQVDRFRRKTVRKPGGFQRFVPPLN